MDTSPTRLLLCGALLLGSVSSAVQASAVRPDPEKPIAGTNCSELPVDNWWHADVSHLPVHARSGDWLSHMSTDVDLHPDLGPYNSDSPQ